MNDRPWLAIAAVALVACAREPQSPTPPAVAGPDPISDVASDDAEMNRAMERARLSLDEFDARLRNPPVKQQDIGLRGRFEQNGRMEHLWISGVRIEADGYHGVLQSAPQILTNLKVGEAMVVPRDRVSDWYAIEDGHLVAGYTMRVFHERMSPEERKKFDETAGFSVDD
jgi:uncharacterized protein YegJ (DUF2314 family)